MCTHTHTRTQCVNDAVGAAVPLWKTLQPLPGSTSTDTLLVATEENAAALITACYLLMDFCHSLTQRRCGPGKPVERIAGQQAGREDEGSARFAGENIVCLLDETLKTGDKWTTTTRIKGTNKAAIFQFSSILSSLFRNQFV